LLGELVLSDSDQVVDGKKEAEKLVDKLALRLIG
jgi:hypothetical protein